MRFCLRGKEGVGLGRQVGRICYVIVGGCGGWLIINGDGQYIEFKDKRDLCGG